MAAGISTTDMRAYGELKGRLDAARRAKTEVESQLAKVNVGRPEHGYHKKFFYTGDDKLSAKVYKTAGLAGVLAWAGGGIAGGAKGEGFLVLGGLVAAAAGFAALVAPRDEVLNPTKEMKAFDARHKGLHDRKAAATAEIAKVRPQYEKHVVTGLKHYVDGLFGKYDHDRNGTVYIGAPDSMVTDERVEKDGKPADEHTDKVHTHYAMMKLADANKDQTIERNELLGLLARFNENGNNVLEEAESLKVYHYLESQKREVDDYKYFRPSDQAQ